MMKENNEGQEESREEGRKKEKTMTYALRKRFEGWMRKGGGKERWKQE